MFYNSFYLLFAETDELTYIHIAYTHFTHNVFSITDVSGFDSLNVLEVIFFSKTFRPAMVSTKPRVGWVAGSTFRWGGGYKQSEREVDHFPRSGTKISLRGSVPPLRHMSSGTGA
jgi:hypothetical protein